MNVTDPSESLTAIAEELGIILDPTQLHIGGERAVMSPDKWVLTGAQQSTNEKVVLKCATAPTGVNEITLEHSIRESLRGLPFAERELIMPTELFYGEILGYTASITAFVEQEKVFTDHTLPEQFFMALHALECQESFHATTREHNVIVRQQFPLHAPEFYLQSAAQMAETIINVWPDATETIQTALAMLQDESHLLQAYDGYLIHSDFVPHNFRIHQQQLYLLDFVSFRLGNKYESWARFINFMVVHSPKLATLLLDYVRRDRGETEYRTLQLMRLYKIIFLLNYYANAYQKTDGNLRQLTAVRLKLWTEILQSVLDDQPVFETTLKKYYADRSDLRTPEEKARQRQFTWS